MRLSRAILPFGTAAAVLIAGSCAQEEECTLVDPLCDIVSVEITPASASLAAIGDTVRFTTVAKDASGNPVAGAAVSVTWSSSNPSVATVDANGLATAVANGTVTISGSTDVVAGARTASLSVSQVGAELAMRTQPVGAVSGNPLGTQPAVEIRDANGNLATNAMDVVAAELLGEGSLSGSVSVAAVNGVATFTALIVSATPGQRFLRFTSPSMTGVESQTFDILPMPAVSLGTSVVTASGSNVASGSAVQLTLQAKDASGMDVTSGGRAVTFTAGGGTSTGQISPTTDNFDGTYTATFTGELAGSATTIGATIGGEAVTTTMPQVLVVPGPVSLATSAVMASEDSVLVGETAELALEAKDAAGNRLAGGGLTVAFTASGGTSNGALSTVTDNGNGTYSATFTGTAAGTPTTIGATINGGAVTSAVPTIKVTQLTSTTDTAQGVPLDGMAGITYKGFTGGLYPTGNTMPSAHEAAGLAAAASIQPLDTDGNPSATGKYVLISIGMSNTTQEWCAEDTPAPCETWTFMGQAAADAEVNDTDLVILNGAMGGQAIPTWDAPGESNYDRIVNDWLTPNGLTEAQVQVAWLKNAMGFPGVSLPDAGADAYAVQAGLASILRSMMVRYPNLKMVFVSSRIYAGYANTLCEPPRACGLNPEPYAYETGFAVKWLIQAQIDQMANGGVVVDDNAGDLDYTDGTAPWIAWGPYLWADGANESPTGVSWVPSDYQLDYTHPGTPAETKVGAALLEFFKTSPFTSGWFLQP